jgi:hypothetical protein
LHGYQSLKILVSVVRFRPRPPDQHRSFASDCGVFVCAVSGRLTPCARGTDPDKPRNLAKSVTVE